MVKGAFTEYYYNKGEAEKAAMKHIRTGRKAKIEKKKVTEVRNGKMRKITRYIVKKYKT